MSIAPGEAKRNLGSALPQENQKPAEAGFIPLIPNAETRPLGSVSHDLSGVQPNLAFQRLSRSPLHSTMPGLILEIKKVLAHA